MNQPGSPSSLTTVCISHWENSSADFGLTTVHAHLEALRNFTNNLNLYRRNAQAVLTDNRVDELLEDSFRYFGNNPEKCFPVLIKHLSFSQWKRSFCFFIFLFLLSAYRWNVALFSWNFSILQFHTGCYFHRKNDWNIFVLRHFQYCNDDKLFRLLFQNRIPYEILMGQ